MLFFAGSNPAPATNMVSVAQLVRAPDCGSGGRRFDPDRSPKGEAVQAVVSTPLIRVTILKKG